MSVSCDKINITKAKLELRLFSDKTKFWVEMLCTDKHHRFIKLIQMKINRQNQKNLRVPVKVKR